MIGNKGNIFLFFCVVFVFAIFGGFSESVKAKALTYEQPIVDPDIYVDVYEPDKTWNGTTLFADYHNPKRPRIIEVNMLGQIVWEYVLPKHLKNFSTKLRGLLHIDH